MAKKKQEDPPAGSPAWMATFSDLMNLLLCFFVLLFSMSSVDAEKFELLIASLQSSFSVLPAGGSSVGEGQLISSGISQLENFDVYFSISDYEGNTAETPQEDDSEEESDSQENKGQTDQELEQNTSSSQESVEQAQETVEEEALAESEEMAQKIEELVKEQSITSGVKIDFTTQYVELTLNGALLFESGQAEIREDAYPFVDKIGTILENYAKNSIEIEGHTDNVPIHTSQFRNNNVLSSFRALNVMEYLAGSTKLKQKMMKSSGRGQYDPVADNSTAKGRAKNRRVEIKIYNSFYSEQN